MPSFAQRYESRLRDELKAVGDWMVGQIEEYLLEKRKVVEGDLFRSLGYEVDLSREQIVFFAKAEHGYWVHEGTDPHWPPPGALRAWVVAARFAPGLSIEKRDYLARKSISETGTPGTPFLREPLQEQAETIASRLEASLTQALQSEVDARAS